MGLRSSGGPSLRIGLTGGIGSGKSTVAELFRQRGAVIIDADMLARQAVEPGSAGLASLVRLVGPQILTPDGHLDRSALGRLIFADPGLRAQVEAVIHPAVWRGADELEAAAPPGSVVVHMIPLLVETGQPDRYDQVIVVDIDPATQLARVQARDRLDEQQARARLAAQASREQRLAIADLVVDNSGDLAHLEDQVDQAWRRLTMQLRQPGSRRL